jgi:hypothetical protein
MMNGGADLPYPKRRRQESEISVFTTAADILSLSRIVSFCVDSRYFHVIAQNDQPLHSLGHHHK